MHEVTCVDWFFFQACIRKFHFLRQAIELPIVCSRNVIKESAGGTIIWLVCVNQVDAVIYCHRYCGIMYIPSVCNVFIITG